MRYRQVPKRLLEETKAMLGLYLFLRNECGLNFADKLSVKDLKYVLHALKTK